jgi:hypothetical protein
VLAPPTRDLLQLLERVAVECDPHPAHGP